MFLQPNVWCLVHFPIYFSNFESKPYQTRFFLFVFSLTWDGNLCVCMEEELNERYVGFISTKSISSLSWPIIPNYYFAKDIVL